MSSGINSPWIIKRVIIISVIISFAGSIIIGAVVVIIIIAEITPAAVAYAHGNFIIVGGLISHLAAFLIPLIIFNYPDRRIIHIIGCLAAFIGRAATADSSHR